MAGGVRKDVQGRKGAAQLLDRENRTLKIVQVFDSEENMDAAEPTFETMPQRLGEMAKVLGGSPRSVDKFEVMGHMGSLLD